jgi:hypothetical protein
MSADPKCSNDIYTQMNYQKVREDNLKKTGQLYQRLLTEYSSVYSNYLKAQSDAIGNPSDPSLQNQSDAAKVKDTPIIIDLNKKLVDVESALLDNNKIIYQDIQEQSNQLEIDNKEKEIIEQKIKKLEQAMKSMEDYSATGLNSVEDIDKQFQIVTFWYYFMLVLNLIIFIVFCYFFYKVISTSTL